MNMDKYDKISNFIDWIVIVCAFVGIVLCINNNVALVIMMLAIGACCVAKNLLLRKVCEDRDSQDEEL